MQTYEIIGIEKRSGTSKKSGKPYDMTILHLRFTLPLDTYDSNNSGFKVESVIYNNLVNPALPANLSCGDCVALFYNRSGFVVEVERV